LLLFVLEKPMLAVMYRMAVLLVLLTAGLAHAQGGPTLTVDGAWARATAGLARNGAAYMTIHNTGAAVDRLVAAASPVAGTVELHAHIKDGDVMRMRQVMAVEIAPGEPAVFQPGGLHVMLLDLKAPLKDGEHFPVTLTFEKAGPITISIAVRRSAPAAGPGHSG
jgi:periplasmic copper chaperone A